MGGSIQQSCGLLHGEERRPPEALGRSEAPPARDFDKLEGMEKWRIHITC